MTNTERLAVALVLAICGLLCAVAYFNPELVQRAFAVMQRLNERAF